MTKQADVFRRMWFLCSAIIVFNCCSSGLHKKHYNLYKGFCKLRYS